jgi:hypothetical protein
MCTHACVQDTVRCITCPTCEVGYYVDAASGNCSCAPCKASCPLHHRMSGSCPGNTSSDAITCIPCTICAPGEWVDQACFGASSVDEAVCKVKQAQRHAKLFCLKVCKRACCIIFAAAYMESHTNRLKEGFCASGPAGPTYLAKAIMAPSMVCTCRQFANPSFVCVAQTCKSSCLPGQYLKGHCDGQGTSDGIECTDCKTACDPGMYLEGDCSGLESVEGVQCYPCPAGTYSERGGSGISSCVPCALDSFSDPGSASCVFATRAWPLNGNVNEFASEDTSSSSGRRTVGSTGVVFLSNVKVQDRTHAGVCVFYVCMCVCVCLFEGESLVWVGSE